MRSIRSRLLPLILTATLCVAACGGGGSTSNTSSAVYSVGGSIVGLTASGLVLANGSETYSAAANSTSFTFPSASASGSTYAVTVKTQPTGLTCTVTAGSGSVGSKNVNSVVVLCTVNAYTIGGTINGLNSAGLILANSGDTVSPAPNADTFTFTKGVPPGATYVVTVQTQPTGETCSVSSGAGSVGNAAVTTVLVTCRAVAPALVTLAAGGTQQFTATVGGISISAVAWQVNGIAGGNATVGTISNSGLYWAPLTPGKATVSAISMADATQSAAASVTVLAPHSIAVRPTPSGLAELYDRTTGHTFTPRGNDYIRLANLTDFGGNTVTYHSTFNSGLYDAPRAEAALASMQSFGYNAVRVFLNGCCQGSIGDPAGGLSATYMANVADFLVRAQQHDIFVIFTQDGPPSVGGYELTCSNPQFSDVNLQNLCGDAMVELTRFHRDFVQALIQLQAPLSAILAYELRNEYYYESTAMPLSLTSGMITTANGSTYDMSNSTSRQQMMDDGLVYLSNQLRAAIVAIDPTALVTIGFFTPQKPNSTRVGDTRVISVYPAIASSTVDFVDIHAYADTDLTLSQYVQNFGFTGFQQQKPVVMAEFGAFFSAVPAITDAAVDLKNWQVDGCQYGIKGWLLWTWDTTETSIPNWWNTTSGDGSINLALAPSLRPDPCVP